MFYKSDGSLEAFSKTLRNEINATVDERASMSARFTSAAMLKQVYFRQSSQEHFSPNHHSVVLQTFMKKDTFDFFFHLLQLS